MPHSLAREGKAAGTPLLPPETAATFPNSLIRQLLRVAERENERAHIISIPLAARNRRTKERLVPDHCFFWPSYYDPPKIFAVKPTFLKGDFKKANCAEFDLDNENSCAGVLVLPEEDTIHLAERMVKNMKKKEDIVNGEGVARGTVCEYKDCENEADYWVSDNEPESEKGSYTYRCKKHLYK